MLEPNLISYISELKRSKNAVILAHYYCDEEVQQVADFVGDSLALAIAASETPCDVILFAGVHFMGQTAKIICPNKVVLEVDAAAGCSLADSCPTDGLREFIEKHPDHTVITYVNTTAEIKALSDICCTSSNAVGIVESLPKEEKILFAPDRNLGRFIKERTQRDDIVVWNGACHVHDRIDPEGIKHLMAEHPDAKVLVHPESPAEVVELAHCVGATSQLLKFSQSDSATTYIVATESGILYNMKQGSPHKTFIPAPWRGGCGCNNCDDMKLNTVEKVVSALETLSPEVTISEEIRIKALRPIERMMEISKTLSI